MSLQTISQVSEKLKLSTRTLRYYEQIGLITSEKKEDYAYRVYTEDTVKRLQCILVLRKLRIPLKQIAFILQNENAMEIMNIFQQNLAKLDEEISSLSSIRDIIANFIGKLNEIIQKEELEGSDIKLNLLEEDELLEVANEVMTLKEPPKYSMGFLIAPKYEEMVGAFEFYQKAFGANKIAEFCPYGSDKDNLHIIMEIHGIEVMLHPSKSEILQYGGMWTYDDDEAIQTAINVLSQDAREVRIDSWPHWPIAAFIIDKYGVQWTLHT